MEVLATAVVIIFMDRGIPAGAWGYGSRFFDMDEKEFYKRYGIISFPRTLLGICVCLSAGLSRIFPISRNVGDLTTISLAVLFGISALIDVLRTRK